MAVQIWLAQFQQALAAADQARLGSLFHAESHWRDVLALTWRIATIDGADAIIEELTARAGEMRPTAFTIDGDRTAPRWVTRAGADAIEAIFKFETAQGRGSGVVRLTPDASEGGKLKAWTLLTALDEIKGHEEKLGRAQPDDKAYSRDFRGPNWLDTRKASAAYADRDPAVLVVGGGQAGLSAAACLGQLGVDTLIVDRGTAHRRQLAQPLSRAGACTTRCTSITCPICAFRRTGRLTSPKTRSPAGSRPMWRAWSSTTGPPPHSRARVYDETNRRWSVMLRNADGAAREMHPRHIVMATGLSGAPSIPAIPTLDKFAGPVLHSSQYDEGDTWKGKSVLVIGSGNSGHDIAQDLHASGAKVTLVQRSSTMVVNVEPSAQLPYALYDEGPLEDCDLITMSVPLPLARKSHKLLTEKAKQIDQDLLDGLAAQRLQARLRRRRNRLAVQISDPRRRLLFQCRLFRSYRQRRDRPVQFSDIAELRGGRRADEERRNACRRPHRAGDRL